MKLKVTMANGKETEAEQFSYVVQMWECGEWKAIGVFQPTKEAYQQAVNLMNQQEFEARVIQLF